MSKLTFTFLVLLGALHSFGQQASRYREAYKIDSLNHDYRSAIENHKKYVAFDDSEKKVDQRIKLEQLLVKYATQKKDRDIRLLQQQQLAEQSRIKQNRLIRAGMEFYCLDLPANGV